MTSAYDQVNEWLRQLGKSGQGTLTLNDEGYCFFKAGGTTSLMIAAPTNAEHFVVSVDLMLVAPDSKHQIFEKALSLNIHQQSTLGASIAYDSQCNMLVLSYLRFIEHTTYSEFENIINNLVDCATSLRGKLLEENSLMTKYSQIGSNTFIEQGLRV